MRTLFGHLVNTLQCTIWMANQLDCYNNIQKDDRILPPGQQTPL